MITENLALLFERDIRKLQTEINAYANETALWQSLPGIANTGGNLCLHLLGNLQYYIGNVLGGSGYIRNRPAEFSSTGIPLSELNRLLAHTLQLVPQTIRSLPVAQWQANYPEKVFDHEMTTEYFLMHLLAHLGYHLGQINYHRRIVTNEG